MIIYATITDNNGAICTVTCPVCGWSATVAADGWSVVPCVCNVELTHPDQQKPADTTPLSRVTMQAIDALHSGYAVFDEYGAEHWAISSKTKELVADTLRDNGPTPSTPVATGGAAHGRPSQKLQVRVSSETVTMIDELIAQGGWSSRSHLIRDAIAEYLGKSS
tara:strand:+ start:1919 stop:2410 length:492 start_codon:yes stop_codon:yes gene_type:complete